MSDSAGEATDLPGVSTIRITGAWENVFRGSSREALEAALPAYIRPRRWFGSKAREIRDARIVEDIAILPAAHLVLLRVEFDEGEGETYVLPVGFAPGGTAASLVQERPAAVIVRLEGGEESGVLYDAVWDPQFCQALLDTISEERRYDGESGDLVASAGRFLARLRGDVGEPLPPVLLGVEQSNTSVRYGDRLMLKLYRRLETGVNPDQEIGQFLTDRAAYANTPPLAGVLEFRRREPAGAEPTTVALLQGFVPNRGDAWRFTLDSLDEYFAHLREQGASVRSRPSLKQASVLELAHDEIPREVRQLTGAYIESASLLGRRTAELHLALASHPGDQAFAPEPFSMDFQEYLRHSMRELTDRTMRLLRTRLTTLPENTRDEAQQVLALEGRIAAGFDTLVAQPIDAVRTRIHGDYHLGQVLYTGDDFMIIDFEGEPARALSERRMKRSPLQDVAGMLRSFHYSAYSAYFAQSQDATSAPELEPWARYWHQWVSVAYLKAYLEVAGRAAFIPNSRDELRLLLNAYLVEKAVYELGYELNNRPAWARIPLQGILQTVGAGEGGR